MKRRALMETAVHFAAWIATYSFIFMILSGSDARTAYGLLSGWWCALYAGSVLRTSLKTGLVAAAAFIALDLAAAAMGLPRMYHDGGSFGLGTVLNTIQRALLFVSPILVNAGVSVARRRVEQA